jgi:hypothetical protein
MSINRRAPKHSTKTSPRHGLFEEYEARKYSPAKRTQEQTENKGPTFQKTSK